MRCSNAPVKAFASARRRDRKVRALHMGVDDAEGCFLLESLDKECKHGMLDDVGQVAGMVGMTVIHAGLVAIEVAPGQANSVDLGE